MQAEPKRPRSAARLLGVVAVFVLLALGSAATFFLFNRPSAFAGVGLIWLTTLVVFFQRSIRSIFGPVFVYDLLRNSRRNSVIVHRCLYAVVLLVALYAYYLSWATHYAASGSDVFQGTNLPIGVVGDFNSKFFLTFLIVQLAVVLVMTPVYAAGAIAEEKERRTLDHILATNVGDAEFVLGKLAARLASMGLLLTTGLPILALTQFLGGVDFTVLLGGFAMTLLTLLTVGSLSTLLSVRSTQTINAVFGTYFIVGCVCCLGSCIASSSIRPLELEGLLDHLGSFALFNLLGSAFLCGWAVISLRSLALRARLARATLNAAARPQPWHVNPHQTLLNLGLDFFLAPRDIVVNQGLECLGAPDSRPRPVKPPVDDLPMLWKEMHVDPQILGIRSLVSLPKVLGWLILIGCGIVVIAVLAHLTSRHVYLSDIPKECNAALRVVGPLLGMAVLLIVVTTAARKISCEREHRTLDGLLTSPLTTDEILRGKLLGALAVTRPLRWPMLVLVVVAVATGALNVFTLPLVAANCAVLGVFFGVLGLWCSQESRGTVQALATLAVFLFLMLGVPLVVLWVHTMTSGETPDAGLYTAFAESLLTPWQSLAQLIVPYGGFRLIPPREEFRLIAPYGWRHAEMEFNSFLGAACSPLLYGSLTIHLWLHLCRRFDEEANRLPFYARRP